MRKPELIACPTCGRLEIDLEKIIAELEQRLAGRTTPVKISVLGCVVNGPGEAREADLGIAAGKGKGVIFKRGEIVRHVLESEMVDALIEEIDKWEAEENQQGTLPREKTVEGRKHRLPLLSPLKPRSRRQTGGDSVRVLARAVFVAGLSFAVAAEYQFAETRRRGVPVRRRRRSRRSGLPETPPCGRRDAGSTADARPE